MADPMALIAVGATGAFAALLSRWLFPPMVRLAPRVRPYTLDSRIRLGRAADVGPVATGQATGGLIRRLFGPLIEGAARRLGRHLDGSSDEELLLRLRHAGLLSDVPEYRRVVEYRLRELGATVAWAVGGIAAGVVLPVPPGLIPLLGVLGAVAGAGRTRGRVDRTVAERRARMRIELYTVNQLLAMHVRVGGGIVQAVSRVVARGNGAVVDELADVLRAHGSGMPAAQALARAARLSAEPHAARTYRLLATGAEHGADLAAALLAHSEDLREARREDLRRAATRRRAAMLIPIVTILAPIMLLFIAAPLPQLVFGAR